MKWKEEEIIGTDGENPLSVEFILWDCDNGVVVDCGNELDSN